MDRHIQRIENPIRIPQPDGSILESKIIIYYEDFFDLNNNLSFRTVIQFYPNGGLTIQKVFSEFFNVAITLSKEEVDVLTYAIQEEKERSVEVIKDPKEEEENLPGLDSYEDFFKKLK